MSKPTKSTSPALFDITPDKQPAAEPDRPIAYHVTPDDPAPFDALLARYADGCDVRDEVLMMIWSHDDPLQQQIKAALIAAEANGRWKAKNL